MKLPKPVIEDIKNCIIYGCYQAIEPNAHFQKAMNAYLGYPHKSEATLDRNHRKYYINIFRCVVDETVAKIVAMIQGEEIK